MIEHGPKQGSLFCLSFSRHALVWRTREGVWTSSVDFLRLGFPSPFLGALQRHVFSNCMTS
jgi:hypothetical protein